MNLLQRIQKHKLVDKCFRYRYESARQQFIVTMPITRTSNLRRINGWIYWVA